LNKIIERVTPIIKLQRLSWYFFFGYFGLVTAISFYEPEMVSDMVSVGIILLLIVTLVKALVMGLIFQRENRKTFAYLCYLLTVILLFITLLKLWV